MFVLFHYFDCLYKPYTNRSYSLFSFIIINRDNAHLPACKKAIKYLDIAGASYKVVRLDNPWQEGNPIRAELGKMNGRSSVPAIFIGGQYVGGFDAGVDEKSPGILEMAFKGTLQERLKEVGAL